MKPNIVFLLIDSFSSEKCYGENKTSVTPNLDSLLKKGTYFTQAINSAPSTAPSVSSISVKSIDSEIVEENVFDKFFEFDPYLFNLLFIFKINF